MCLIKFTYLTEDIYFDGMWLGVASRTDTKKDMCSNIGMCAQNMVTILNSVANIIGKNLYNRLMQRRTCALVLN